MKKMSIKIQVILLVVVSLVLSGLISTYISSSKSKEALIKANDSRLSMGRDLKKNQIQAYFTNRIADINVLATNANVKNIANDLIAVHKELNVQATDPYPVNHPLAKEKTALSDNFFQFYAKGVWIL